MVLLVVTPPEPTRRVREEVEIYEERGGDVRTPSFADRLYGGGGAGNANSNSTDPPPLDAANLRERKCRTAGDGVVEMDPGSHLTFDLGYYRTVLRHHVLNSIGKSGRGRTGGASWTKVREDARETKTVTQSRQSLRKMMPKSRCSRTVKDETSCRICQTRGQLGTNTRAGVANTARARQWRCCLSVFQQPVEVDHGRRHCSPRGRCSGNPKFDSVDACLMPIGCRSRCSRALERTDHWKGMRGDRLFLETWRGEGGVLDRQGPGADAAGAWWRPAVVRRRALLASSRCRQGGAEVGRWRGGHHVVAAESRRLVASGATGTGVAPLGAARRWRGDPATYTLAV
uniref:Uncharacterized protein n=1 Tax=Oryza sativa subsp. japonica TaxID=39947 RepID=Q6H7U0_ORYSJ|nr:hypothetical protein [Oryza sativa Japonica Group]